MHQIPYQKIITKTFICLIFLLLCATNSISYGATHYASTNGTATWANSTNINTPCSLATANANAAAGDIVNLRAGTYTGQQIAPANSGSDGNRITFQAYTGETPTITESDTPLLLSNRSYITVNGITITNCDKYLIMANGHYNILCYLNISNMRNFERFQGFHVFDGSSYNWIHNNNVSKYGLHEIATGRARGDMIYIGRGGSHHNLIENNHFCYGGHNVFTINNSNYNVVRNNFMHNEDGWDTGYGKRISEIREDTDTESYGWNLIEGNRFSGTDPAIAAGSPSLKICSSNNIFRNNMFYDTYGAGLQVASNATAGYYNANNNRVYNNIIFYSRSNYPPISYTEAGNDVVDNVFKNNIFWGNGSSSYTNAGNIYSNNSTDTDLNPLFTDAQISLLDPTSEAYPDFTLQSISPCIDAGAFLTTITSATQGAPGATTFVVADSRYFFDGWGLPSYMGVTGDEIKTENGQTATITNVNYSTNTITVDPAITWTQNEGISLIYYNTAPDIGAFEWDEFPPNYRPITNIDAPATDQNFTTSPQTVNFSGSGSDIEGDPFVYEWDYDYDGVTFDIDYTGQSGSYEYSCASFPCQYVLALRGTDAGGSGEIETRLITFATEAASGGTRMCKLTIPGSQVEEDCTQFPVLAVINTTTCPNLAAELLDADGSYPANADGGDIRFFLDAGLTQPIARHIIAFARDNDPANGEAIIRFPRNILDTSDVDVYIVYHDTEATEPAADSTYGSEAVYKPSIKMYQPMNQDPSGGAPQMLDATSHDNDGTSEGTMTSGDLVAGKVGNCLDLEGIDDTINWGSAASLDDLNTVAISMWAYPDDVTYLGLFGKPVSGSTLNFFVSAGRLTWQRNWSTNLGRWKAPVASVGTGSWQHVVVIYDSSSTTNDPSMLVNGTTQTVSEVLTPNGTLVSDAASDAGTGRMGTTYADMKADELCVYSPAPSLGWFKTQYNNENSPNTFVVEGTPQDAPSTTVIQKVYGLIDKVYKEGDTVSVIVQFSAAATLTDADANPETVPYLTTNATGATLNLSYASGSGTAYWTFSGTVAAGTTAADLNVLSLVLNGDTIDADTTIPTAGSLDELDENSDIEIDTTTDTITDFIHSNSSGTQIDSETIYTTGDVVYFKLPSSGDAYNLSGSWLDIALEFSLTYPSTSDGSYYTGAYATDLILQLPVTAGMRTLNLVATGTDALDDGDSTLMDYPGGNSITKTLPGTDPTGGNIIVAGEMDLNVGPNETHTSIMNALVTYNYLVGDDDITYTAATTETSFNASGAGRSGHPVVINGGGYDITYTNGATFDEAYYTLNRIKYGSEITLSGSNITANMGLITTGWIKTITGTGIIINNHSFLGTSVLDVDVNTTINNCVVTDCALATGITLTANNCFFAESKAVIQADGGTLSDTNCTFSCIDFGLNTNNQPKRGSVLINAGTDVSLTEDLQGNPIKGAASDVGCYEYQPYGGRSRAFPFF